MATVQINDGETSSGNSPFSNPKNNFAIMPDAGHACDIPKDGMRLNPIFLVTYGWGGIYYVLESSYEVGVVNLHYAT